MSLYTNNSKGAESEPWPSLPLAEWQDTYDTLHLWSQIVGKIALVQAPLINHWWHTTLRVTTRGLTTLPLPYGERVFQISFDFVDHQLRIEDGAGEKRVLALGPISVADFYDHLMGALASLGLGVRIWTTPVEVESLTPFPRDRQHASYDPEYANRFWRILVQTDRVFRQFRSRFIGKVSPVHFFWGSFDLAVTRFSGRRAPAYSGGAFHVGRWVMEEAYSHEQSSLGFWPGGGAVPYPAFYSYVVPQPVGFTDARVRPEGAYFNKDLGEFILPYDRARVLRDPAETLLAFAQSTYAAAADLGDWPRADLECADGAGARAGEPRANAG
ncbi:MAG: DUF5996 family protein [Chloroflexota bacterium]